MTDLTSANVISDLLRTMSTWLLDRPAFWILGIMYEIFFNVASAELFSNATIKNFYSRVQLIIGVFMVFKLAVTILQGIMNPDKFTDKRDGFSNIITRIIISLVMLTVIVPINIPGINSNSPEYQIQLNNNGLLFGTLYSLQNRLLSNNTLGRLVLGTTDDATNTSTNDDTLTGADKQAAKLERSANIFTSTILKGFLRINLLPEDAESRVDTGDKPPESDSRNWMCGEVSDEVIGEYRQLDASPHELLSLVNASCEDSKDYPFNGIISFFKKLTGQERYVFAYIPILPAIVAFIFAFILLGFTVDIAVRSVKLAVLRLIAPIPIISYIDPKSAKDGAFASWVKVLTSTYLDLFIRLAVVYFVIFLIQDMIVNGIVINTGSGLIGIISFIFICLGLFFFAKQAPKFIRDVLGLKGQMSNIGLSAMLAGVGAIRQGGNIREVGEAMYDSADAQVQAYNSGKQSPLLMSNYNAGRDYVAKVITGDQNMTGRRMSRGQRHLNDMGIDTVYANDLKKAMYDQEEALNMLQDQYNRFTNGHMSNDEMEQYARDNGIALTGDIVADSDRIRKHMYDKIRTANKAYQKAKSEYEDVKGMQKQYGQARSYEAQYEARGRNRSVAGFGRTSEHSSVQQWRTQNYPTDQPGVRSEATDSTTPINSSPGGPDVTPTGATTSGPPIGGMGGPNNPAGGPPGGSGGPPR